MQAETKYFLFTINIYGLSPDMKQCFRINSRISRVMGGRPGLRLDFHRQ